MHLDDEYLISLFSSPMEFHFISQDSFARIQLFLQFLTRLNSEQLFCIETLYVMISKKYPKMQIIN